MLRIHIPQTLHGQFLALLALPVVFFVLAGGYYSFVCLPENRNRAEQSRQQQESANDGQQIIFTPIGPLLVPPKHQRQAIWPNDRGDSENQEGSPFCDTRFTDVLLVIFTYCLVVIGWVGIRSSELTLRSLERADLSLLLGDHELPQVLINAAHAIGLVSARPQITWRFFNNGRSAASIDGIRAGYVLTTEEFPPDDAPFMGTQSINFLDATVASRDHSSEFYELRLESSLSRADLDSLAAGGACVFFFGAINYTDVFDGDRETVFCMRSERDGTLRYWGGRKYNYRK